MQTVLWQGPRPAAAVRARLLAAGLQLGPAPAVARVIATSDARRVPVVALGPPWIWVCGSELSLAAASEAIRHGAYEAISLREPAASERLAARLGELGAPEAAPPATPGIVAESAAVRRVLRQVWR